MNQRILERFIGNTIGYENLLNAAESLAGPAYPPHNIERIGENDFVLTLAVAGYKREDLSVKVEDRVLVVSGKGPEEGDGEKTIIHRGISSRSFRKGFQLDAELVVKGAALKDGLLAIELERVVPDEKKPRDIEIAA